MYMTQMIITTLRVNTMHVIEDEGRLRFYQGTTELTPCEGFERLDQIYGTEPQETKRVIDRLKEKYRKDLFK